MTYHPHTLSMLAGSHEADLAREADAARLARLAAERPGNERHALVNRRHQLAAIAASVAVVLGLALL